MKFCCSLTSYNHPHISQDWTAGSQGKIITYRGSDPWVITSRSISANPRVNVCMNSKANRVVLGEKDNHLT